MSIGKDLKEGNWRAWGLLISIVLILLAFALPWHTASKEITAENDKTSYIAGAFNVRFTHQFGSTIVTDESYLYNQLATKTGFNNEYLGYLTFLLPALLLLVLLAFVFELWKGEFYDRKGAFHALGVIMLFIVIVSFVGLYGAFLTFEWGCGFWSSSQGIVTVLVSAPDWGFWCLVAAFGLSLITIIATKDTLKLLLPKMKKR